jgi:hypothetical protein
MIRGRTQITLVSVQTPLLTIVPSGKKISQSFHALHKQLINFGITGLHIEVMQAKERPHKPVHDSRSGQAGSLGVYHVSFGLNSYAIPVRIKLKNLGRTFKQFQETGSAGDAPTAN